MALADRALPWSPFPKPDLFLLAGHLYVHRGAECWTALSADFIPHESCRAYACMPSYVTSRPRTLEPLVRAVKAVWWGLEHGKMLGSSEVSAPGFGALHPLITRQSCSSSLVLPLCRRPACATRQAPTFTL